MSTGRGWVMTPEEKAAALEEAKARGLPIEGWSVELDKRKRRKWIAPNNRSCDSIPKALAISVELGMLPANTVIPTSQPKRKRGRPPKAKCSKPGSGRKLKIALDLTQPVGNEINDEDDSNDNESENESNKEMKKMDELERKSSKKNRTKKRKVDSGPTKASDIRQSSSNTKRVHTITNKNRNDKSKINEGEEEDDDSNEDVDDDQEEEVEEQEEEEEEEEEEDQSEEMEPPTNPETTLDYMHSFLTTVHFDPNSSPFRKIGWRIRVSDDKHGDWKVGRIIRYDPCTHKHKIQFWDKPRSSDKVDHENCAWLHLRIEDGLQISTRLVWAHVKGYAWWPAMVMESDIHPAKDGYVHVEFFGSDEVAVLRANLENLRPFENGHIDSVIQKNKKKRNSNAMALAIKEEKEIQNVKNKAARFYAKKAFEMSNTKVGQQLVGSRIQIWRDDVNYPYGDTVSGRVKQYSESLNKWLVTYEISDKVRKKYDSSWINLISKEHKLRILEKHNPKKKLSNVDLLPFLKGFKYVGPKLSDPEEDTDAHMEKLFRSCCSGCGDYWKKNESKITCNVCHGQFHLGCCDPPLTKEAYHKILYDKNKSFVCSKCQTCVGCYQKDLSFGCHIHVVPKTLSFPEGKDLMLCSMCTNYYNENQFCPNCAHSWDDEHFQHVQRQIRWQQEHRPKKRGRKRKLDDDSTSAADFLSFTASATVQFEDPFPEGASVNPTWYHPETAKFGFTEQDMLTCDSCSLWTHAGCAGLNEEEYELCSKGKHEIYSTEFLCRVCCRERCLEIINKLQEEDKLFLFAEPVTESIAPNYLDIINNPMDLRTILIRAERDEYKNYAWVRELFELMVLNALTFNRYHTAFWIEAKRYYDACLKNIFSSIGKAAPPSKYEADILKNLEKAKQARQAEEDRVQEDKTTVKKDLVAGSDVVKFSLPTIREKPPDQPSCLPCRGVKLKPKDAYFCAWMECCFTCGSSGASDTMLFCVDCGEAFHSFCVNAPIHSMDASSVAAWRCPNCKICEISGDSPNDELKMLFCEMCDRGFSLDLLDPPLSTAPKGIWICGQCIDCKSCNNTLEPNGPSLKHWSRNPHLCYRCGGCDGLSDLNKYINKRKCTVCSRNWRDDDLDMARCDGCGSKIHARCDSTADAYIKKMCIERNDRNFDPVSEGSVYHCPSCRKKQGFNMGDGKVTRDHMADFVSKVVFKDALFDLGGETALKSEFGEKLMEQIDWKTRNLWRDEYRKVVSEGVRFLNLAKDQFGDPRYLMDRFWHENEDLPAWMGQRATRFLRVANKMKLNSVGFSARRIEQCVTISKLAASWLKVACRMMGMKTKKNVKGYDRMTKLLVAPHASGSVDLAFDSIRCERNRNIISKDDWHKIHEPKLRPYIQSTVFAVFAPEETNNKLKIMNANQNQPQMLYKIAQPLCGWNNVLEDKDMAHKWCDPRECCLCHLCGDDDAGLPDDVPERTTDPIKPKLPPLGRLLPLSDGGLWVHSACALWSSETWESHTGGLVHALEKARSRGAQLRCFGCGRPGATVGCVKQSCSCNFHFPCAFACGAVFTSSKEMFCSIHKGCAEDIIDNPSSEMMDTLIIAQEKGKAASEKDADSTDTYLCPRYGALIVHQLGEIEQNCDGFHTEDYIMPRGYIATRIYWSTVKPRKRTVYVLKIESSGDKPVFCITPGDDPLSSIKESSAYKAYNLLVQRVQATHACEFSHGNLYSKLPTKRNSSKPFFGLNAPHFFGFGLDPLRKLIEGLPGCEAVATKLSESSPRYLFCHTDTQPSIEKVTELQRRRALAQAEKKLENASGCARAEGMKAVTRSGGSDRITRALVRNAEIEDSEDFGAAVGTVGMKKRDSEKVKADRSRIQRMYHEMKIVPIEQRLTTKRSHIHGWGLFTKVDLPKDSMIVEYMGEVIRKSVADSREKAYEISGEGSCYMFRLDLQRIVDATQIGCMARFMNHCCKPNAYAKVISVDVGQGRSENKIMIFSLLDIKAGDEITYDYKFPVEDGSLKCTCGAPNCIGRMN